MKIRLSRRLQSAADMVRRGARVADIGCDHGRLCAFLIQSGQAAFAFAVDKNEKPLQKAQMLFEKCGISDRVMTQQADGLARLSADDVDDVIIAGLGADVCAFVIAQAEWLQNREKRLVLVPSSRHAQLRIWLCQNGMNIVSEKPIFEAGHCYTVMMVSYTGKKWRPGSVFAEFGKIDLEEPDYGSYEMMVRNKMQKIISGSPDREKLRKAQEVMKHIEKVANKGGKRKTSCTGT